MKLQRTSKYSAGVRGGILFSVVAVLILGFIYKLIVTSGLISGYDDAVDARAEQKRMLAARAETYEGTFYDRNGYAITVAEEKGVAAKVDSPEAYSYLIGYNSSIYGVSGLRSVLYDELLSGGMDHVGAEVTLTIDDGLQKFCSELLQYEGSICVMDTKTGELLSCVSRSDAELVYNVNEIDTMYSVYAEKDAFFINRATMSEDPPGSTFKVVLSACMLENGMRNYVTDDGDGEYLGIHNHENEDFEGDITLEKALNSSVNIYFAKAGVELGHRRIQETAEKFHFGSDIELDFCTLKSNFNLGSGNNKNLLAQTSFGQGKTAVSPLQLCMVMGAVLNEGKMMRPCVIDHIEDEGRTIYKKDIDVVEKVMKKSTAMDLKQLLHSNALFYGIDEDTYEMCYAKTGTADMANGKNHIYFLMGLEVNNQSFAIIVDQRNTDGTSGELKCDAMEILNYLISMYK